MHSKAFFATLLLLIGIAACNSESSSDTPTKTDIPGRVDPKKASGKKVILFFGNSLTAGYGVQPEESFPSRIQQRIDSLGYPYHVVNAGVSGETTSGGLGRIDWVLKNQPLDIFILELGGNDGLRGIPTTETRQNLERIIAKVRAAQPGADIILAGMLVPPNMGPEYSARYQAIFPEVAKVGNVDLIPFLLKDVGGVDSLNQDDGIHPNPTGAKIVAENVWEVLKKHLEQS